MCCVASPGVDSTFYIWSGLAGAGLVVPPGKRWTSWPVLP